MKNWYDARVLEEFLKYQLPHLAMIRSIESKFYQKYLPLKRKILDVGCGDGFFSWSIFKRQKIEAGIDIENSKWQEAQKRGNYKQVLTYDGYKIPFKKNSFQTIICNCVLEHVPKVEVLIKEMNRVVKPKGLILATVVTDKFGDDLLGTKILGKGYKNWFNKKSKHVANVSETAWRKRFEEAGFKIKEEKRYMNYKELMELFDISHYWGFLKLSRKLWGEIMKKAPRSKKIGSPYLFLALEKIRTLG